MLLEQETDEFGDLDWEALMALQQKPKYKVVLLGQEQSGKTALWYRFIHDVFIGSSLNKHEAHWGTKSVSGVDVELWNLDGSDRLGPLHTAALDCAHAVVLVVDPTRRDGLDQSYGLLSSVHRHFSQRGLKPVISVVFSKGDLDSSSCFSAKERQAFVAQCEYQIEQSILSYSVSAKKDEQIDWFFEALVKQLESKPTSHFRATQIPKAPPAAPQPEYEPSFFARHRAVLLGSTLCAGSGAVYGLGVFAVLPALLAMNVSFALAAIGVLVFAIKALAELGQLLLPDRDQSLPTATL